MLWMVEYREENVIGSRGSLGTRTEITAMSWNYYTVALLIPLLN